VGLPGENELGHQPFLGELIQEKGGHIQGIKEVGFFFIEHEYKKVIYDEDREEPENKSQNKCAAAVPPAVVSHFFQSKLYPGGVVVKQPD
jgi:hypothetical protein